MTTREAAERLGVDRARVTQMVAEGKLTGTKEGRRLIVDDESVESLRAKRASEKGTVAAGEAAEFIQSEAGRMGISTADWVEQLVEIAKAEGLLDKIVANDPVLRAVRAFEREGVPFIRKDGGILTVWRGDRSVYGMELNYDPASATLTTPSDGTMPEMHCAGVTLSTVVGLCKPKADDTEELEPDEDGRITAPESKLWVLTKKGYAQLPGTRKEKATVGLPLDGYDRRVPAGWVKTGMVELG